MIVRRMGRFLPLIVAFGLVGSGTGLFSQTPAPPATKAAPSAGPSRLKAMIESAEAAAAADDWDSVSEWVEHANELVDSWTGSLLSQPETTALLERLKAIEVQLAEETSDEPEDGIKMAEETVVLTGEDLRAQLEQVKAAEKDAVFDFPIDLNEKVLSWVYDFTHGKRGFVEGALSRGTQYLPMARQIFAEEGVPQDLAFLALIESGFKNTAHSPAQAVGMWQFIRSTGRAFGLDGNAWIEERKDPVKSCRASARYLRQLHASTGDWYLALAGYNAGPLTVERAAAGLGTRNYWDMARSAYLRDETKHYVPKLLAAILVGRFPERYNLNVIQMPPYAYEVVDVDRMTSLTVLAKYASTDVEVLKDLNPELLRATTPPGRYSLKVPPGTSGIVNRALAGIPSGQRLDFQPYLIRKGDTLARVAARFKVTQTDLLEANNLKPSQFRAGRRIQVPPPASVPIDVRDLNAPARVAKAEPLMQIPSIEVTTPEEQSEEALVRDAAPVVSTPVRKEEPATTASTLRPGFHVVKRGETLFSISERYGINLSDLRKWNKIRRNHIAVGQRLRLKKG